MILICNDKSLQKMKPLISTTFQMPFRRYVLTNVSAYILDLDQQRSDQD